MKGSTGPLDRAPHGPDSGGLATAGRQRLEYLSGQYVLLEESSCLWTVTVSSLGTRKDEMPRWPAWFREGRGCRARIRHVGAGALRRGPRPRGGPSSVCMRCSCALPTSSSTDVAGWAHRRAQPTWMTLPHKRPMTLSCRFCASCIATAARVAHDLGVQVRPASSRREGPYTAMAPPRDPIGGRGVGTATCYAHLVLRAS